MKVKNKISLNLGLNLDPRCEGAPAVMDGIRNCYLIQISVFKIVTGMRVLLHINYYTYDIKYVYLKCMYKANLYLIHTMFFLLLKFADGSPRSRVCASNTLGSAPIDPSQQISAHVSANNIFVN